MSVSRLRPDRSLASSGGAYKSSGQDARGLAEAVGRGVIVVEAAGNGAQDLDDPLYEIPNPGFPADWKNPFRRANRDPGAILVGAGAPPPGTHGRNMYGPDRSRLDFSNYGSTGSPQQDAPGRPATQRIGNRPDLKTLIHAVAPAAAEVATA
jgi:hypothetical protein